MGCDKLFCLFQALELQKIDGLSVYSQEIFEAAVIQQVDDALEQKIGNINNQYVENKSYIDEGYENGNVEETEKQKLEEEKEGINDDDDDEMETEMERRIRLGEMTPFGTTLITDKHLSNFKTLMTNRYSRF